MKVFYIGKFHRFFNTENYVSHALEQNGAMVVKRPYTSTADFASYTAQIEKHQPDIVLFCKATSKCFPELILWCRERKVTTVCWVWDPYWGFRNPALYPPQFKSDLLFTTDGGHPQNWIDYGANHHVLRQGIHEPDHIIYQSKPRVDLAFVGTLARYGQRDLLINWLRNVYKSRVAWHTSTRGLDLNRALAETKIVVGTTWFSNHYWSNRVYEILGRGGFLLFPETVGLDEEFTAGVHYVSYPRNDFKTLGELIKHYCTHDAERERIRNAGFERCARYTYTSRVKDLLQKVEEHVQGGR